MGVFSGVNTPGIALSEINSPATTISVYECLGDDRGMDGGTDGDIFAGHLLTSNYLYADGHVKSLRPRATIANNICQWYRDDQTVAPNGSITAAITTAENAYK